jgi:hypothetical protein
MTPLGIGLGVKIEESLYRCVAKAKPTMEIDRSVVIRVGAVTAPASKELFNGSKANIWESGLVTANRVTSP